MIKSLVLLMCLLWYNYYGDNMENNKSNDNTINTIKVIVLIISALLAIHYIIHIIILVDPPSSSRLTIIEHQSLINTLQIITCILNVITLIVLNKLVLFSKKTNKSYYYKVIGIFCAILILLNFSMRKIDSYITNEDVKHDRYIRKYNPLDPDSYGE